MITFDPTLSRRVNGLLVALESASGLRRAWLRCRLRLALRRAPAWGGRR